MKKLTSLQEMIIGGTIAAVIAGFILTGVSKLSAKDLASGVLQWVRSMFAAQMNVPVWLLIVLAALAILLVYRLIFPTGRRAVEQSQPRSTVEVAESTVMVAAHVVAQGDERIFLTVPPRDMIAPFKEHTAYQAEKLVADYKGKWVRWSGQLDNVWTRGDITRVSVLERSESITLFIWLIFAVSETPKVVHLPKGTTLQFEGRITEIRTFDITLEDCRLVAGAPNGSR
jgi:hypothetical protein